MASVNKVILVGNLGADPEMRYTPGGQPVAQFNIATTDVWTDKSNVKQEKTEWHRIVVWGKQAEHCKEYLAKGRQVYVEGRIQTRTYDDKNGQKRTITEIIAQTVKFMGSASNGAHRGQSGRPAPEEPPPDSPDPDKITGDDIPF
ncbi:MAG: single-stranded DNA-binding protein [Deltaproteobacteria bacterium]|nr:single-stranded DNA-binding protein [Deltaproteobacteria bacterium]